MNIAILFLIYRVVFNQRLDINSLGCKLYLDKFNKVNENGTGPTSLAFRGDTLFINDTKEFVVTLTYFDALYNDPIYYGLSKEDGKPENTTCLDLQVFYFQNSNYTNGIRMDGLEFNTSSNILRLTRSLSFTQNAEEYQYFIRTYNSNQKVMIGYFALVYLKTGTEQVVYTFYFQCQIKIDILDESNIPFITLISWNQYETQNCSLNNTCIIQPSTTLKYCTDRTCSVETAPFLYFQEQFYIQQVVKVESLKEFYLIDTKVYYLGDGLLYQTIPLKVNNQQTGQVTLLLSADLVWNNFTILITSVLAKNIDYTKYTLKNSQSSDPVTGVIEVIPCVRFNQTSSDCAQCGEECFANGFARARDDILCWCDSEARKAALAAVAGAITAAACCCPCTFCCCYSLHAQ